MTNLSKVYYCCTNILLFTKSMRNMASKSVYMNLNPIRLIYSSKLVCLKDRFKDIKAERAVFALKKFLEFKVFSKNIHTCTTSTTERNFSLLRIKYGGQYVDQYMIMKKKHEEETGRNGNLVIVVSFILEQVQFTMFIIK